MAWGRKFVVILDDDNGGRNTKKRLIKTFGKILENKVFTLKNVNNEWNNFEMENLFVQSDQLKIINVLYPEEKEFDKSKFNTAIQHLLINKEAIKVTQHTIKRFEKLLTFLDKQLSDD